MIAGAFKGAGDGAFDELQLTNREEWLSHVWHIRDGRFENRGNGHDSGSSTHAKGAISYEYLPMNHLSHLIPMIYQEPKQLTQTGN